PARERPTRRPRERGDPDVLELPRERKRARGKIGPQPRANRSITHRHPRPARAPLEPAAEDFRPRPSVVVKQGFGTRDTGFGKAVAFASPQPRLPNPGSTQLSVVSSRRERAGAGNTSDCPVTPHCYPGSRP